MMCEIDAFERFEWTLGEKITENELAQTKTETHQFPNKFHTKWNNEKNKTQMSKHSAEYADCAI